MGKHSVSVSIRVRPCGVGKAVCDGRDSSGHQGSDSSTIAVCEGKGLAVEGRGGGGGGEGGGREGMMGGGSQQWFRYAQGVVLGSDQGEAYNAIAADLVERLWEGFSCTLVAYGQTGSGKTFTM